MLKDMQVSDIVGDCREVTQTFYAGAQRKALVTEIETPYPDGKLIVSSTDPDGLIKKVNQAFIDMSGYTEAELIGQPHCILRHPDMPSAAYQDLWATVRAGRTWQGYVKNLRKDGGYYWVKATVIPNIRKGQVVGYTSVRRKPSRAKVNEAIQLYSTLS